MIEHIHTYIHTYIYIYIYICVCEYICKRRGLRRRPRRGRRARGESARGSTEGEPRCAAVKRLAAARALNVPLPLVLDPRLTRPFPWSRQARSRWLTRRRSRGRWGTRWGTRTRLPCWGIRRWIRGAGRPTSTRPSRPGRRATCRGRSREPPTASSHGCGDQTRLLRQEVEEWESRAACVGGRCEGATRASWRRAREEGCP